MRCGADSNEADRIKTETYIRILHLHIALRLRPNREAHCMQMDRISIDPWPDQICILRSHRAGMKISAMLNKCNCKCTSTESRNARQHNVS